MKNVLTMLIICLVHLSASAWACSIYIPPEYTIGEFVYDDGIVILEDGIETTPTVVVKLGGVEIEGTSTREGEVRRFVPTDGLVIGESYQVTITDPGLDDPLVQNVKVIARNTLVPTVDLTTTEVTEITTGIVCCKAEQVIDSCGGGLSCWPEGYAYHDTAKFQIDNVAGEVFYKVASYRKGETPVFAGPIRIVGALEVTRSSAEEDAAEDFCSDFIIEDADGNALLSKTICSTRADFPAVQKRRPDAEAEVDACIEPPDDENDPNWQRYGAGCSSVGTGPKSLLWLFAAMAFLGVRRRRRC